VPSSVQDCEVQRPQGDQGTRKQEAVRQNPARLEEPRLASQRYVPSDDKRDEIGAIALGAKLEKALARRMSGQDYVMREPSGVDGKKAVKEVKTVSPSAA